MSSGDGRVGRTISYLLTRSSVLRQKGLSAFWEGENEPEHEVGRTSLETKSMRFQVLAVEEEGKSVSEEGGDSPCAHGHEEMIVRSERGHTEMSSGQRE